MKRLTLLSIAVLLSGMCAFGQAVQTNTVNVDITQQKEVKFSVPQGESKVFLINYQQNGTNIALPGYTGDYLYNYRGYEDWYQIAGTVDTNAGTLTFPWGPSYDPGELKYNGWCRILSGTTPVYRVKLDIQMIRTPGFSPNASLLTNAPVDFSTLNYTNVPAEWTAAGTFTNVFSGAGTTGSVSSTASDTNLFLRGDGTWAAAGSAATNGLASTNWVDTYYYPRTNPSNYVGATITNGLASTNWVAEYVASNAPAGSGNPVDSRAVTNDINLASYGVTNGYLLDVILRGYLTTNAPSNGQVMKYDAANQRWYGANDDTGTGGVSVASWSAGTGLTDTGTPTDPVGNVDTNWLTGYVGSNATLVSATNDIADLQSKTNGYLTAETDPVFTNWLNTNAYVQAETDPVFTNWLNTNAYIQAETDPVFTNWLDTNAYVQAESDPIFTNWLAVTANVLGWDTAYGWGDHSTNGYVTSTITNGLASTNYVGNALTNYVPKTGGTLSGSLLTTVDHIVNAPSATELVSAEWVRSLNLQGSAWFFSTNVNTLVGATNKTENFVSLTDTIPTEGFTNTIASPVTSASYLAGGVATQLFGAIRSPISFEMHLARNGGGPNTVIPVKPEIYYMYAGTTNLLGDWGTAYQNVTAEETTKFTFTVAFAEPVITGSVHLIAYLKSGTVSGAASGLDIVGGNGYPSHLDVESVNAGETAQDVQANLDTHTGLVGVAVHGLGSASTNNTADFYPSGNPSNYINAVTGNWSGTFDSLQGAAYLDRANHTGTQAAGTISDFDAEVANNSAVALNTAKTSGTTNLFAGSGTTGLVTSAAGDADKYLKADGTWATPAGGGGGGDPIDGRAATNTVDGGYNFLTNFIIADVYGISTNSGATLTNLVDGVVLWTNNNALASQTYSNAFSVYCSSNFPVGAGATVKVGIDTEEFDPDGMFRSGGTNRFYPLQDGFYQVTAHAWGADASQFMSVEPVVYKNGSAYKKAGGYVSSSWGNAGKEVTMIVSLETSDYLEFYVQNTDTDSANTFQGGSTNNWFAAHRIDSYDTVIQRTEIVGGVSNNPCFLANKAGTDQSAPTIDTWTAISFTNEVFDAGSDFNPTTGIFTAPQDGVYQFNLSVGSAGDAATWKLTHLGLYTNGSLYSESVYPSFITVGRDLVQEHTAVVELEANDTVKAYIKQETAVDALNGETTQTSFAGSMISR